ncbi:D-alanyl-D-alanine carboxypeptidase family protein [Candidatus Woesearchaeota archaeon]|nr:D-alanyl-D-alanine carboxypeptidase family protein [Candidatus Woesearchaeota archaeon]
MTRKKAQGLLYGVAGGLIAAIIVSIFVNLGQKEFDVIGASSLRLLGVSNDAESALLYIDQSAKYSLQQAVYDLAQNGGFYEIGDFVEIDSSGSQDASQQTKSCGKFDDAAVWYEITKDSSGIYKSTSCFDESALNRNLEYEFNKNLNKYLSNYPTYIPQDNYNFEIKDSIEITGRAVLPIEFSILKDEAKAIVIQPKEVKITAESRDLIDFTGTELCAKGRTCLLTKPAYDLLLKAQEIAKQNKVSLEVTFGYRTMEQQQMIWNRNPDSRYVCPPSPSCPHLTGNVVDIVIKGSKDWKLLHKIMSQAGWVRYGDEKDSSKGEPWHFECCGTSRYAKAKAQGVNAIV